MDNQSSPESQLQALQAQLDEAKEQLTQTKAAHNLFIHKISHDIKTPCNEILETFTQLELLALDESANTLLASGRGACLQLDRLLEQMLTLDALQNQRTKINRTELNLTQLLEGHISQLNTFAQDQGKGALLSIGIYWECDSDKLCSVIGDKEKLNKIISELLLNALEHTPKGSIMLNIKALEENASSMALDISVQDTGDGMTQQQVDKVFTPFINYADFFHGSTDKAGLSLMLCQKLTHLMSGNLSVESTQGVGTKVSIKMGFPLLQKSKYLRSSAEKQKAKEQPYIKNTEKPILVVDDNAVNRNVLCAITRRLGFETKQATHGKEAVELCQKEDFALIFMDCQMPVMNGFEATAALREMYQLTMPIIAVTANSTDEDIHSCFVAGMDDFISKPVTPHKIGEALSRWLTHKSKYTQSV